MQHAIFFSREIATRIVSVKIYNAKM